MKEGYKNTIMGVIPNEWRLKRLKDVSDFSNGKGHEKVIDEKGKYIVVNSKFISTDGKVKKFSNENLSPLKKQDITIVMSDIPNGKAIAKCFIVDENDRYTLNQRIGSLTANQNIETKFLYYVLNRNKYYLAFDNGVGQTNLRKDEVLDCPIQLPPLLEQQKIAEILSTVDAKIEAIDQRIAETQALKKGLMQQLLTKGIGHTKFKDSPLGEIPEGWEVKEFGAICEITSSKRIHRSDYIDEGIPFFRGKEITQLSKGEMLSDLVYISEDKFNVLKYKFGAPIEGDILITSVGTIGSIYLVKENDEFYFKDGNLIWLRNIDAELNRNFLAQYLNSVIFQGLISNISSGSSQKALTIVKLKGLPLAIPPKNEQLKIAEILNKVKEKLQIQQDKKAEYQELKKGLMQQLLTGKIRVKV